jgi:hypothetical protein
MQTLIASSTRFLATKSTLSATVRVPEEAALTMRIKEKALVLILLSIALLAGCVKRPRGNVSNIIRQEHPMLVNGDMDWGSEVGFDLKNEGERGMIHVTVTLSCSEGQWVRSQELLLETGQSMHLTYFFQEPTITASNYQALVRVEP